MNRNRENEFSWNVHKNYVKENGREWKSRKRDESLLEDCKLMNWNFSNKEKAITRKKDVDNHKVSSFRRKQELHVDSLRSLSNRINKQRDKSKKERRKEFVSSFDKINPMQKGVEKRRYTGWNSSNDERNSKEEQSVRKCVMKDFSKEIKKQSNRGSFERTEKTMSKLEKYANERYIENRRLSKEYHIRIPRRSKSRLLRKDHRRIPTEPESKILRNHYTRVEGKSKSKSSINFDRRIPRRSKSRFSKDYPRRLSRMGHGRSPIRESSINQIIQDDGYYKRNVRKEKEAHYELQNVTIPKLECAYEIPASSRNEFNNTNVMHDNENVNDRFIFVENVRSYYNLDQLFVKFSQYGFMREFACVDRNLFIAYDNAECAKRAIQEEHGKMYIDHVLNVKACKYNFQDLIMKEKIITLQDNPVSLREQNLSVSETISLEKKVALRIVVKGLDPSVSLQDLKKFGQVVGPLNLLMILEDSSRELFGVIEYKLNTYVERALDILKHKRLNGKQVSVARYNESYEFGYREIEQMQFGDENRPNPKDYEDKYEQSKEKQNSANKEKFEDQEKFVDKEKFVDQEKFVVKEKFEDKEKFVDKEIFVDKEKFANKEKFVDQEKFADKEKFVDKEKFADKKKFVDKEKFVDQEKFVDKEKFAESSYHEKGKRRNEKKYGSRERISRLQNSNSQKKIEKRENNNVGLSRKEKFYPPIRECNRTKRYMRDVNNEAKRRKQVKSHSLKRRGKKINGEILRKFPIRESCRLEKERNHIILPKEHTIQIGEKVKKWERERDHMEKKSKFLEKNAINREEERDLEKMNKKNKERMHSNEHNEEYMKYVETRKRRKCEKGEQNKENASHEIVKQMNEKLAFSSEIEYRENTNKSESLSTTDVVNFINNEDQKKMEEQMKREMEEKLRWQIKEEIRIENENKIRTEIEKKLRVEIEEKLRKEHEEILRNKLNEILKMHNEGGIQMENLYSLIKGKCKKQQSFLESKHE